MGIVPLSSQPVAAEVIPSSVRASPHRRLPIEAIQAWLFLLPAVVILGVFQIFPAIAAFYMSLFQKMRGRGIYRTVYYLPYVTSFVAAAAVFFWVFHPQYGLVNDVIGIFGIGPQRWLDEPNGIFDLAASGFGITLPEWLAGPSLALVVLSLVTIWHYLGYQIVIFLAGLSNISQEFYEAARLD